MGRRLSRENRSDLTGILAFWHLKNKKEIRLSRMKSLLKRAHAFFPNVHMSHLASFQSQFHLDDILTHPSNKILRDGSKGIELLSV